ncbi:class F sortase [Streptomyces meridianus]|uniref:Class F sortase n=1 Tax=Streptomyces meridianus TaxID=2938945 RepID=A0ABT0X2R9_9ACTN|nr:class F sortase [Streptomyces meridianus]MCM2576836.1 class F sortase [Streptomyces meridianus]
MVAQQPSGPAPARKPPGTRSLGKALLWPAASVGLGALLIFNSFDTNAEGEPQAGSVVTAPSVASEPGNGIRSADPALPRSEPERIRIPEIAVDAPFTPLTLNKTGQLNAPPPNHKNLAGWFEGGATPGERGTSVVAGHVDTRTGPAVFLNLSSLKQGSTVEIAREDGVVATFEVDSVETFNKDDFPDDRVYADAPTAQLRLITCGGDYDRKAKDYEDNVVVFAHLASTRLG